LNYSLAKWGYLRLLTFPNVNGHSTYIAAVASGVAVLVLLWVYAGALRDLWKSRSGWREIVFGTSSQSRFLVSAVIFGFAPLLALPGFGIPKHYWIVTFPLEWVFLSSLALKNSRYGERLLWIAWVAQLLIAVSFLDFIHVNHGAPDADYGTAYRFQ
jgi:hypothetical protein